jgi:acetylornithine deacetylase/succinyl-diaminopimelate desuccinylase-like protein
MRAPNPPNSLPETDLDEIDTLLGGPETRRLLAELVACRSTNLEDPLHGRWEKPNYLSTSRRIADVAKEIGVRVRTYDPTTDAQDPTPFRGIPRPNLILDLDRSAPRTVLILTHYDVVPVPVEQLDRWKSPPHTLTPRADGRLYGRGSNDDLGSGVVATLTALRRVIGRPSLAWNVRVIVACDEETGGQGGIEALKEHDLELSPDDPGRFLAADAALIPDGSPEVTAGSSGLAFLSGEMTSPVPLSSIVGFGESLVALHEFVRHWKSVYASPDWPDHGAPEPVVTGRATLTQWDVEPAPGPRAGDSLPRLLRLHAETDAGNQIPERVTLVFEGSPPERTRLSALIQDRVAPPFRIESARTSAIALPPDTLSLQLVGRAAHGGYPHRGANPVPPALKLLASLLADGVIDPQAKATATSTVDLRLIPEMELDTGLREVWGHIRPTLARRFPEATLTAPPERCRSGYALSPEHPLVRKLARIMASTLGAHGVYGEYGGTDASALRGLRTPSGEPLPALVFGSMDRDAHIHDAEESVDPRRLAGVIATIERFLTES